MEEHNVRPLGWLLAIAAALNLGACATQGINDYSTASFAQQATVLLSDNEGLGSGVVIAPGHVLTVAHVVGNNATINVTLSTGEKKTGRILWTMADDNDIALVAVDTTSVKPAEMNCARAPMGTPVFSLGHPLGLRNVATWGRVASDTDGSKALQTNGAIFLDLTLLPGNSGGGVWDRDGKVVGLADAALNVGKSFTGLTVMVGAPTICAALASH